MQKPYIAHIREATEEIQTVKQHCENTAELCSSNAVPEMQSLLYAMGIAHDIGKYQKSFQCRISGENIRVEHSTCGALVIDEKYPFPACLMMEYCIAGHHSGLPDGGYRNDTEDMSTLAGRMKRHFEDYSVYQSELAFPELNFEQWQQYILKDCGRNTDRLIDKFAFLTRYAYSCLVDADSKDTADFCRKGKTPRALNVNFFKCLEKVNERLSSFHCETVLQQARACLQAQAFASSKQDGEIYLMNMPTGSGKTLAGVKIALEKAIAGKKKRIIYVIPYNSIIDQTAEVFENIFGEDAEILRHQSTFSFEDDKDADEDYRQAAKCAVENWQAPFIITTAVQFFESVYSNKRGKLRKLHNMADSILIFDEAHLMPQNYLQPCLQSIAYITRYLNSEALFLTATMPDFSHLLREYALPDSRIVNLISDTDAFSVFQKCRYRYLGETESEKLLEKVRESPSALVIVNTKRAARSLYQACTGRKFHLSTYMTPVDRQRVLKEIRTELSNLEADFPTLQEVPNDRKITVFSTSLIEAGVDLDAFTVFRETAGLDSILQAGGRCNREGKRKTADVFIFDFSDANGSAIKDEKRNLTKGMLRKYSDISAPECIREYYDRLFFMNKDAIQKHSIHTQCCDIRSIPFQSYAKEFELIDGKTVSLVVPRDEKSKTLIAALQAGQTVHTRQLQEYSASLYQRELDDLIRQGAVSDYGSGVFCLTNPDYYDENIGILFDARDYFL
ncbi:MAG: CRISPR-associated helicase Cas3' [Clostridiales bacterium]|nr:CRISPR-associated helicase Cas3' [Clostridiales bacterium]